jgi:hypothetical protein
MMRGTTRSIALCALGASLFCGSGCGDGEELELEMLEASLRADDDTWIDTRRSLAITDVQILKRFSFQRVMDRLARDSRARGATGISLFRQWWSTQNPGSDGPHCNQEVDAQGRTLLNSYPYDCRPSPSEGAQANCRSFDDPACAYIPIGLFNRFDRAPEDGAHCGEHRVIFAKRSGQTTPLDRNLVIFEAVLRNPLPWLGIDGCRPLVEAWATLSFVDNVEERARRLERMYFDGVSYFPPVISWDNFGDNPAGLGQIRTNQFMIGGAPFIWTLREFKLQRSCQGRQCTALAVPVTDKDNPISLLFGDPSDPRAAAFQDQLVRDNVASLASTTLTDIAMITPDRFNSGQSHSSGSSELDYATYLATQRNGVRRALWQALGRIGSDVTPEQLVLRARTQTCGGCHELSNNQELGGGLFWPPSLGFVHVSEVDPETVGRAQRYRISPLLVSSFLPLRARVMFDFLQRRPWRRRGFFGFSVGGRFTH